MLRLLHPGSEVTEQWLGSGLPDVQPHIHRLAADLVFDGIQGTDPGANNSVATEAKFARASTD